MPTSLRTLILPFTALCIIMLGGTAYMVQASVEPVTATEYVEYRNDRWNFFLAVPTDMIVSESAFEGRGYVMQFMDAAAHKSIDISATPYTQLDVAVGLQGDPSDTSDQPRYLGIVDVVRDDDHFVVLFQKGGIRYVVVTLADHEAWLTDILTTWQFID